MEKSTVIFILLISTILCLFGCSADRVTTPSGAIITFDPPSHTQTGILADTTVNFTVTVTDADGNPMNKQKLHISGPFAVPRATPHYQFYRQLNGIDPVNSGFTAETDSFGTYSFSVILNAANGTFGDNIVVLSGSNSGTAAVAVQ